MKSPALRLVIGSALQHNPSTLKTLFPRKYPQFSQYRKMEPVKSVKRRYNLKYVVGSESKMNNRLGGNLTLTIYGTGSYGTPRCLVLSSQNGSYIFNCGEGMQRTSQEHKLRLTRVQRAFVTSPTWDNIGGLIGLGLTINNIQGSSPLKVHCPKGIDRILTAADKFLHIARVHLEFKSVTEYEKYSDSMLNIWHIPLKPENTEHDKSNIDSTAETVAKTDRKRIMHDTDCQSKKLRLSNESSELPCSEVLCYICKIRDRPGTLNLSKCLEYGIRPGPMLGTLKNGNSVTLEDGTIVHHSDVCNKPTPGPEFMVVDVPSKLYLKSFLNDNMFQEYQNKENSVRYIFHFTPREIVQDPCYVEWMAEFGAETEHILIDNEIYTMNSEAVMRHQYKLNLIHSNIFPLLPSAESITVDSQSLNITTKEDKPLKVYAANALEVFYLLPEARRCLDRVIQLQPHEYVNECMNQTGFPEILSAVHRDINAYTESSPAPSAEYPKIVMLGTGCSMPCKYRNTSGILLQIDQNNNILLDCGEGIMGQIQRYFTRSECETVLRNLKGIFISHLHADHHLGLFSVLLKRAKVTQDPIHIIGPDMIWLWIRTYNNIIEQILDSVHFISSDYLHVAKTSKNLQSKANVFKYLNISEMCTTRVCHPGDAFGVRILLNNNQKITYSGDTTPSDNLISLGLNSDLLIHEATMDDFLEHQAQKAFHSTTCKAINVGRQMHAKFTLLTHFSQRYAKLPFLQNAGKEQGMKAVGVAYDFMEISMSQLMLLPLLYPALESMFADDNLEYQQRAMKSIRKQNEQEMRKAEIVQ